MFEDFPKSDIDIVAPDGKIRHKTKAMISDNLAVIDDPTLTIEVGDEPRRVLPNGQEETFEVVDPTFYQSFHGIAAHYQVKMRRKGVFSRGRGGNYEIHIQGPNSRVNIHSMDASHNVVSNDIEIFAKLSQTIALAPEMEPLRATLLGAVAEMQNARNDKASFSVAYTRFITAAANHITIIAPFLPALGQMLGS